ncbi:MAG: hypothetical protein R3C56_28110 [Pirellulaceae bacterium]
MAYNVTVLDRAGTHATVFVSPDKDIVVSRRKLATNHQDTVDWPEHARPQPVLIAPCVVSSSARPARDARAALSHDFSNRHCTNTIINTAGERFIRRPIIRRAVY